MSLHGKITKVHATIHTEEYKFIRGLLAFNFGEPLPVPPPLHYYHASTVKVSRSRGHALAGMEYLRQIGFPFFIRLTLSCPLEPM